MTLTPEERLRRARNAASALIAAGRAQKIGGTMTQELEPCPISHEAAASAAKRLIDYYFGNKGELPRASIPARPDYDDDLVLTGYIKQQSRTPTPATGGIEERVEAAANALWAHLDLNGHTLEGVKRAARAALKAAGVTP